MRDFIYKIGKILSQIIGKNIAFFIALGILNILSDYNLDFKLYSKILSTYILPGALGFSSAKIQERRAGVPAVIAVTAVLAGRGSVNLMETILIGTAVGYLTKIYFSKVIKNIKPGMEMLTINIGTPLIAIFVGTAYFYFSKITMKFLFFDTEVIVSFLKNIYGVILISGITELGKIFFLNNIINHGVFSMLGFQEVIKNGKSIFFLIETNPGPGLGVLLAFLYKIKKEKRYISSAIFIQFFGGIHEVYFPFILENLSLLIPLIIGGMVGSCIFYLLNVGLISVASPGSIFTLLLLSKGWDRLYIFLGVLASTMVTFFISSFLIKKESIKIKKIQEAISENKEVNSKIKKIAVVCDAGMGSSAIGANILNRELEKINLNYIEVINTHLQDELNKFDIIVTHENFSEHLKKKYPEKEIYSLKDYLRPRNYLELLKKIDRINANQIDLKKEKPKEETKENISILVSEGIKLGLKKTNKDQAILSLGTVLYENGYVEKEYIEEILKREINSSTYLARGVAIPHGTRDSQKYIKENGIVIHQYPYGIDYGGKKVYLLIGIAIKGEGHLDMLEKIASIVEDKRILNELEITDSKDFVLQLFKERVENVK